MLAEHGVFPQGRADVLQADAAALLVRDKQPRFSGTPALQQLHQPIKLREVVGQQGNAAADVQACLQRSVHEPHEKCKIALPARKPVMVLLVPIDREMTPSIPCACSSCIRSPHWDWLRNRIPSICSTFPKTEPMAF